jgi:hypothetical protein
VRARLILAGWLPVVLERALLYLAPMSRSRAVALLLLLGACDGSVSDGAGQDAGVHGDGGGEPAPDAGPEGPPARTFEGEPVGEPPTGTRTEGTVTVEDVTVAGVTTRAVRVLDASTESQSRLIFLHGGIPARRFTFDLLPRSGSRATLLAVHGSGATEDTGTWRIMIAPSGTAGVISVWDGAWSELGSVPGLHDPDAWSRVEIEASTTYVSIIARGVRFTTTRKAAFSSGMTSLEIASSGTAPTGTDTYIDNLTVEDTGWLVATEAGGNEVRFPDLAMLADGRLLAVYQSAAAHTGTSANASSIKMTTSSDGGQTWTTPVVAANSAVDDRDPKVAVLSDGTVLLNWFQDRWSSGSAYENLGLYAARMAAGESSFGPATHLPTPAGRGFSHAPVVELGDGELILPYYNGGARVIRSHDGGATWDPASDQLVVATSATRAYVEPNIARLPGGELVMVIRTVDRSTGVEIRSTLSRSGDDGLTWSALEETGFTTSSHHMLMTSAGAVLLTFGNPLVSGRPTYSARIDDPTAPWTPSTSPQRLLYSAGSGDQANPSSVELRPGRYLTLGYDVTTARLFAFVTTDAFYD